MTIRKIRPADNPEMAHVIKSVLTEYKADPKTTMLGDPSANTMYENYQKTGAVFFVLENDQKVVGGCGIAPLKGSKNQICELQRMYLLPQARGKGFGKKLVEICIEQAQKMGYKQIYLETLPQMKPAQSLYKKYGFGFINHSLGNTGHTGCEVWMLRDL